MSDGPLRICLLSYRGNPRSGGQGIYVRLLSDELTRMGHHVDVWSGPPYPELTGGVRLYRVPSLDLWNEAAFFRRPSWGELADRINLAEYTRTMLGSFPEPLTFSQRVARRFARGEAPRYDIVHDNQSLGPGLLALRARLPVVATIHHPVTVDRRIAFETTRAAKKRFGVYRWYNSFLPAQQRVARALDRVLTVSEASAWDLHKEYGIDRRRTRVVGNGINIRAFRPLPHIERAPRRLITTLSADTPLKGFRFLLQALAILRPRYPGLELTVIGTPSADSDTEAEVRALGLEDAVHFTGKLELEQMARLYAQSVLAVVPSLYEGFGFPAGEAMACQVPVVCTRAGALPEVVGSDGSCGVLVEPGSGSSLAHGIASLLDDPERRTRMGRAGRQRVERLFTWAAAARRTLEVYREVIDERTRSQHAHRAL